jgi:hypothetical protein
MTKHQQKQKELRRRLREDEKFRKESAQLSINVLSVVPVYILLEQYGWKRKRLSRFILRYQKIIDDIANKRLTTQALADELKQLTKIEYDDGIWDNILKEV